MNRIGLLIGATGVLIAGTAFAGYSNLAPVSFFANGARGSVAGALLASDANQEINCTVSATATLVVGTCFAYDSANTRKECISYNPDIIATMRSVGPASYINFTIASDNSTCGNVAVHNGSRFAHY